MPTEMIPAANDNVLFQEYPKIPRLSREVIVTEKIDGTNAQIIIRNTEVLGGADYTAKVGDNFIYAGSRKRIITPTFDNFGFAGWVRAHAEELIRLGPGRHYGEWWGVGIQRGYGLTERRFSLFNTFRWGEGGQAMPPACCHVVPILWRGEFDTEAIEIALDELDENGSHAAPGFKNPEGVIVFHTAAGHLYKKTFDDGPKSIIVAAEAYAAAKHSQMLKDVHLSLAA